MNQCVHQLQQEMNPQRGELESITNTSKLLVFEHDELN